MCRTALLLVALAAFAPTTSVSAQEEAGEIARAFVVKAKPGMGQKFEEAYKKHVAWHEQQNDDWTWDTWQFQTGERFGQYMIRTEGHHWQDFDATADFQVADGKHFMDTAGPYVASTTSFFSRIDQEASRMPADPPSIVQVTSYLLHPGKGAQFTHVVKKLNEANAKTNRPVFSALVQTLSGVEQPSYAIVSLHKNWAGFEPPDQATMAMLVEIYGQQEAEALRKTFYDSVRSYSTNVLVYQPELSYRPSSPTSEE